MYGQIGVEFHSSSFRYGVGKERVSPIVSISTIKVLVGQRRGSASLGVGQAAAVACC